MRHLPYLALCTVIMALASCVRTEKHHEFSVLTDPSKIGIEIVDYYLKPTDQPDEYEVVRIFKLPDGRSWNPGRLILRLGQEVKIPSPPDMQENFPKQTTIKLVSVDDKVGIIETIHVLEVNGKEQKITNQQSIPLRNN